MTRTRSKIGDPLTPTEIKILGTLWAGFKTRDVAEIYGLAPTTIKTYVQSIKVKLADHSPQNSWTSGSLKAGSRANASESIKRRRYDPAMTIANMVTMARPKLWRRWTQTDPTE